MNRLVFIKISFFFFLLSPFVSYAATLSLSPTQGEFSVGSTFNVSILLDTKGESINAVEAILSFPPDMIQVISPSTGQSIIGVWTASPKFDNKNGRVELQGGIPSGITASNALISNLSFRVKSVGDGIIRFLDKSKVLLNNGLGTNVLTQTGNSFFRFKLPPPLGPVVVSSTNPDQATWYNSRTVSSQFLSEGSLVEGYSYILSDEPTTIPDDIIETKKNSVSYSNLSDGVHYFHVKSIRGGIWGGTTHFAFKVDSTAPALFEIKILPSPRTSSTDPIIQFTTTDALSGVDHYDLKIVPLSKNENDIDSSRFFFEVESPYVSPSLELGNYDVIIRAHDKSGNFVESVQHLRITTPLFSLISNNGIQVGGRTIPWMFVWFSGLFILLFLLFLAKKTKNWRRYLHLTHEQGILPEDISLQLEELKKYRQKYGSKILLAILIISSIFFSNHKVEAQTPQIAPPLISTVSKNISNDEIFYVGGKTDFSNAEVVIYLQNLGTGETFSQYAKSDNEGDWFYRHNSFLSPGNYLLWAQGKIGEELSPPGPQVTMTVNRTAVQFGGGRLSYETIYLFLIILLLITIFCLSAFIAYHFYHGKKKHKELKKYIEDAEGSIKRGFALLKHDIEAELHIINKIKLNKELGDEEREKETKLLSDLVLVQKRLGREIWEISKGV